MDRHVGTSTHQMTDLQQNIQTLTDCVLDERLLAVWPSWRAVEVYLCCATCSLDWPS